MPVDNGLAPTDLDAEFERTLEIRVIMQRLEWMYGQMAEGRRDAIIRQRVSRLEAVLACLQGFPGALLP